MKAQEVINNLGWGNTKSIPIEICLQAMFEYAIIKCHEQRHNCRMNAETLEYENDMGEKVSYIQDDSILYAPSPKFE